MKMFLKGALERWKRFGNLLGVVQTYVIITLVYFSVLAVVAVFVKAGDALVKKKRPGSYWMPRRPPARDLASLRRQF